jgi:hypothetical protein
MLPKEGQKMNQAHLHLMTNHVPILGSLCGLLVLGFSFFMRAAQAVRTAAYLLFVFSAIGAIVANWTGEGAEKVVEDLPGWSHSVLEEHEEAGKSATPNWSSLLRYQAEFLIRRRFAVSLGLRGSPGTH